MHDGQDDAGRHEVGEGEVLGPVDRLLEDQRDAGDLLRDAAGSHLQETDIILVVSRIQTQQNA